MSKTRAKTTAAKKSAPKPSAKPAAKAPAKAARPPAKPAARPAARPAPAPVEKPAPPPAPVPPAAARLVDKLHVKPGTTIVVLGAPAGYRQKLGLLPEGARLVNVVPAEAAFVHLFARDGAALSSRLREVSPRLTDDAVVWVSYPKADSGAGSDLNRDKIVGLTGPFGLTPVSVVSMDKIWSALRFKRVEK